MKRSDANIPKRNNRTMWFILVLAGVLQDAG